MCDDAEPTLVGPTMQMAGFVEEPMPRLCSYLLMGEACQRREDKLSALSLIEVQAEEAGL